MERFWSIAYHPIKQTIRKIIKKFKDTGNVENRVRPVHLCSAYSTENIAAVRESKAD